MQETTAPRVTSLKPSHARKATASPAASSNRPARAFIMLALDMSWRLAIVVLVPLLLGSWLDKRLHTSPSLTIVGFVLAMAGTAFVLWQALQAANRLPVPKLSAAQKRAIKKQYEEEDDD